MQDHLVFQRRSRSVSERRRWRIRPILGLDVYGTLSIYLAGVELVKLSEMLEKAYIPRRFDFLCARDLRAKPYFQRRVKYT